MNSKSYNNKSTIHLIKYKMTGPAYLIIAATGLMLTSYIYFWSVNNKTTLRNSSGKEITSVQLTVKDLDSSKMVSQKATSIAPGQSLTLKHKFLESEIELSFTIDGQTIKHSEGFVDLWWGETWLINILPDGSIKSNHH